MSRVVDIETSGEVVLIYFPYDAELVACVKSLPRRRWNGDERRWEVPLDDVVEVISLLEPRKFSFSPRMRDYWAANDLASELRALREGGGDGLTVSEVNRKVEAAIRSAFQEDIWVVGELSNFDPGRNRSNHAYFELVERREERVTYKVPAVLFANELDRIKLKIEREGSGRIELRDGLEVRLRCRVDFFQRQGRFQLQVQDFDVAYATGKIQQARDKVLRKLESEGILRQNLDLQMPDLPLRVGLITSFESDAQNDFVDELDRSPWAFEVVVHDSRVQGQRAEHEIVKALSYFAARADRFDVVAIVRGGGARSDLSAFDSLEIGRAVCQLGIKVVCGVGHHLDQSVLDFVCESLKTPTAAASHLVARVDKSWQRLSDVRSAIATTAVDSVEDARAGLDRRSRAVVSGARMGVRTSRHSMQTQGLRLKRETQRIANDARSACDRSLKAVRDATRRRIFTYRNQIDIHVERLDPTRIGSGMVAKLEQVESRQTRLSRAAERRLERAEKLVDGYEREVRLADPARVLERGFAIVRRGGKVVARADLKLSETVEVQFHDGRANVTVDDVFEEEDE